MSWEPQLQTALARKGLYSGAIDGLLGPKSLEGLFRFCGAKELAPALAKQAAISFGPEEILDHPNRVIEWFGENGHESSGFIHLEEIWGPTAAQRRYEGRVDLGNTHPGDGYRFRGRGVIMNTGRANYARLQEKLGLPLIQKPELLARPDVAVKASLSYWKDRSLNQLADLGRSLEISIKINGRNRTTGLPNGNNDRIRRKKLLRGLIYG